MDVALVSCCRIWIVFAQKVCDAGVRGVGVIGKKKKKFHQWLYVEVSFL